MLLKMHSAAASFMATMVFFAFVALNVNSNTSPDDFTKVNTPRIEIGYGWPLVGITGSIDTERHFYATGFWALWQSTTNPQIAWFGFAANFALGILLVSCVYYSTHLVQSRLKLQVTILSLAGATTFSALVLYARMRTWNEYAGIDSGIPMRMLVGDVLYYAELIVWGAILVTCLTLPEMVASKTRPIWSKAHNQETHGSSVGGSTLHDKFPDGSR